MELHQECLLLMFSECMCESFIQDISSHCLALLCLIIYFVYNKSLIEHILTPFPIYITYFVTKYFDPRGSRAD